MMKKALQIVLFCGTPCITPFIMGIVEDYVTEHVLRLLLYYVYIQLRPFGFDGLSIHWSFVVRSYH